MVEDTIAGESKPDADYLPFLFAVNINPTPYAKSVKHGDVRDVLLQNVSVIGADAGVIVAWVGCRTYGARHQDHLRFNGKQIQDAQAAHLAIGPQVSDVQFK